MLELIGLRCLHSAHKDQFFVIVRIVPKNAAKFRIDTQSANRSSQLLKRSPTNSTCNSSAPCVWPSAQIPACRQVIDSSLSHPEPEPATPLGTPIWAQNCGGLNCYDKFALEVTSFWVKPFSSRTALMRSPILSIHSPSTQLWNRIENKASSLLSANISKHLIANISKRLI